ncbi:hypothetical protein Agub_g8404, partial [Astrephomene gubernaculifera]
MASFNLVQTPASCCPQMRGLRTPPQVACCQASRHAAAPVAYSTVLAAAWLATARNPTSLLCLALPSSSASSSQGASSHGTSTSSSRDTPAPYKWSWQEDLEPTAALELDLSAAPTLRTIPEVTAWLQAAAANAPPRATLTAESVALLNAVVHRLLPYSSTPATAGGATATAAAAECTTSEAARLLEVYSKVSSSQGRTEPAGDLAPPPLVASLLTCLCTPQPAGSSGASSANGSTAMEAASARELADLLWAVSELQEGLPWDERTASVPSSSSASSPTSAEAAAIVEEAATTVPATLQRAVSTRLRNQDFLAPDLCRAVCALGSLAAVTSAITPSSANTAAATTGASTTGQGSLPSAVASSKGFQLNPDLVKELNEEVRFQLTEFHADFEASDLGRLISGMGRLGLGAAVASDEEYRRILMKAVYGKTRS